MNAMMRDRLGSSLLIGNPLMIAHIVAKMTLVKSDKLVATGVHDKANVDPSATMSGRGPKL